ncbi:hypothetical protein [Halomonas kalidii]|uniref:Uncharacterized protein n=1 Tax=Halomonas kalidii TaxID=3043293 RepID=A0ABT6VI81_9GAMM|nr:hypothetical protein [Halomonas kalidii]MDI5933385.1 hypothetical protein [Halomonas kalidii]
MAATLKTTAGYFPNDFREYSASARIKGTTRPLLRIVEEPMLKT